MGRPIGEPETRSVGVHFKPWGAGAVPDKIRGFRGATMGTPKPRRADGVVMYSAVSVDGFVADVVIQGDRVLHLRYRVRR